jgi:hypothetical protein
VRPEPVLISGPDALQARSQRWPEPKVGPSVGHPRRGVGLSPCTPALCARGAARRTKTLRGRPADMPVEQPRGTQHAGGARAPPELSPLRLAKLMRIDQGRSWHPKQHCGHCTSWRGLAGPRERGCRHLSRRNHPNTQMRFRWPNARVWTCSKCRYLAEWGRPPLRREKGSCDVVTETSTVHQNWGPTALGTDQASSKPTASKAPYRGGTLAPVALSSNSAPLSGRCRARGDGRPRHGSCVGARRAATTLPDAPAGVRPCSSPTESAGSAGRIRTYDQPVNSRLLYR